MKKSNLKKNEPQRRLSRWRLLVAILVTGFTIYAIWFAWQRKQDVELVSNQQAWFAAYVDVTSTPRFAFEQVNNPQQKNVVLAFVVSSHEDPCTPSWGAAYTLDEAGVELDLDRRIARLQQQDGKIAISFGGALNDELAVKCHDQSKLKQAYQSVIDRYHIDTVDLDLENSSLVDSESLTRRAEVISQLQSERRAEGKNLAVWLTLPVGPNGLTEDGTAAVAQMLANGVDLAGLNVMTMDYGESKPKNLSMADISQSALIQSHRQLGILYDRSGIHLSSVNLWHKMGATPMIGQNDVVDEVFTIDNAAQLNQFAQNKGLGRISMWSANRDSACGDNYPDLQIVSDACSGVSNAAQSFTEVLGSGFTGDLTQNSMIVTTAEEETTEQVVDDPATSPYQIWQEAGTYLAGTKVVWHGNVYEAKWWTKGDLPDNPVLQSWETPWELVGPVLPGEKPIEVPTLPDGTYPEWSGNIEYETGDRILFEGIPFQAKWWNQGQSPAAAEAHADSSPWSPLTRVQIQDVLDNGKVLAELR